MTDEELRYIINRLKYEGKITPFEESLVLDYNRHIIEIYENIKDKTPEENNEYLNRVLATLITPNITRLSKIQGSNKSESEYYNYALKIFRDFEELIDSLKDPIPKTPLDKYFKGNSAKDIFITLLDYFGCLKDGKLKQKKTEELIEIFLAFCDRNLTDRNYFIEIEKGKLTKAQFTDVVNEISKEIKKGGVDIAESTVTRYLNNRTKKNIYIEALSKINEFIPY